jgi:hypothetical protein
MPGRANPGGETAVVANTIEVISHFESGVENDLRAI